MTAQRSLLLLLLGGCATATLDDVGDVDVAVRAATSEIPIDGQCAEVIATRLSDFTVTTTRDQLSGMTFKAPPGEHRVTATAYPQPCNQPPAAPPWIADEQVATFTSGPNTVMLSFKKRVNVAVNPVFESETLLEVRAGSLVRTGRNGEDASGPDYSLDGWEVKQLTLPPIGGGASSEVTLFSVEGQGGIPYTPRGMARLADGRFVFQQGEVHEPLRAFSAGGAFIEEWPVIYPEGAVVWDNTDGIDVYGTAGGLHLVRTGWLNAPIGCEENGPDCIQAGVDILAIDEVTGLVNVERQIFIRAQGGLPLNQEYPVGVVGVGDDIAVALLPGDFFSGTRLVLLSGSTDPNDPPVLAGPVMVDGDVEGIFVSGDGRLMGLDYTGVLTSHDAGTLALRPAEGATYPVGADVPLPVGLSWDPSSNRLVALSRFHRVVFADPSFTSVAETGIALSGAEVNPNGPFGGMVNPAAAEVLPGNLVGIMDRLPPREGGDVGPRTPRIERFSLATGAFHSSILLTGSPSPTRVRGLAYIASSNRYVVHHRRPGLPEDATVDAVAFIHDAGGAAVSSFDLRPHGFRLIQSVNYLPATDELLFKAIDVAGAPRFVVTSLAGVPRRSYPAGAAGAVGDLAPMTGGPFPGDLGAVIPEPSSYLRLAPL